MITSSRIIALIALALTIALPASAQAEIPFCTFGNGPGECVEPAGIAVDRDEGHIYVADRGNSRINVFGEDGDFLFSFGTLGPGNGQFMSPTSIAVDNDPTSPAFHGVYIVDRLPDGPGDTSRARVQRFDSNGTFVLSIGINELHSGNDPVAVGPGGTVHVADNFTDAGEPVRRILNFTPAGVLSGAADLPGAGLVTGLAVDTAGDAYVSRVGSGELFVEKYALSEPNATPLDSINEDLQSRAIAVSNGNDLYVAQKDIRLFIGKYDSSGALIKRFGYGQIAFNLNSLVVGTSGTVFGSESNVGSETQGNRVIAIPEPPAGPLPCCQTQVLGNTKATLKGEINPQGKSTAYHFEYLSDADFIANGNDFEGPNPPAETPESAPIGSDFELHLVQATIGCPVVDDPPQPECLEPSTLYHVRLVAISADGETFEEDTFETLGPFDIEATFATEVIGDSAVLNATVNPLGIPATAYFEYVDEATFQESEFNEAIKVPSVSGGVQPIDLGSGNAGQTISASVFLAPNTAYRYRVKVVDSFVPDGDPEGIGPERTLSTFPSPPPTDPDNCANAAFRDALSRRLPDCRAYEMVSPIDKSGGDIRTLVNIVNYPTRLDQSASDGESFTYSAVPAFADPESAPFVSQYLARRIAGQGWANEAINPPRESVALTDNPVKFDTQFKLFSADLSNGWLFQDANPALSECGPEDFLNLYRRDNTTGGYEALIMNTPPSLPQDYRIELQGASADGTRAIFRANAKLTPDAAGGQNYQLYIHVAGEGCGQTRLLGREPNGSAPATHSSAGTPGGAVAEYRQGAVARAISMDGSRVFFSLNMENPGPLNLRINADREQSPIAAGKCADPEKACTLRISTVPARFWSAASDGSVGIYSIGDELFEYDVPKALAGETASAQIAKGMEGVVGASEDASRIYFVSTEMIGGEGEAGQPNLYLYRRGESGPERYRLVATVNTQDLGGIPHFGFSVGSPDPVRNGTRLTPSGSHLAFVSTASLTGFDNTDVADRRPALEIFLYDAESDQLACISCNPSGARPQGRLFEFGLTFRRVAAMLAPAETQTFTPRALTEDGGKLFFESFEALTPRDVNETMDVYEWQRAESAAECQAVGAELFASKSGGCLSLISSGQDEVDSEFADASPDGTDVFIRTASSLVPQDPGQVDVYDVRAGGGLPTPVLPGDPCETPGNPAACPGPVPPAPGAQAPASSTGQSSGNVAPKKPKSCPKGKVPKKGKCVKKGKAHKKKGKAKNKQGAKRAAGKSGGAGR